MATLVLPELKVPDTHSVSQQQQVGKNNRPVILKFLRALVTYSVKGNAAAFMNGSIFNDASFVMI